MYVYVIVVVVVVAGGVLAQQIRRVFGRYPEKGGMLIYSFASLAAMDTYMFQFSTWPRAGFHNFEPQPQP